MNLSLIIHALEKVIKDDSQKGVISKIIDKFESYSDEEKESFFKAFAKQGHSWGFQPKHFLAREVTKVLLHNLFGTIPIEGLKYCLDALDKVKKGHTVVMIGNHLSYGDVNFLHSQLELNGHDDFPLLVMAGPKVYSDPFRLFSSMVFDSLKMAQPPSKASAGASVSRRELSRITRKVLSDAVEWQDKGRILYFFPEGSRSRDGNLNKFIPAVSRYIERKGTLIYPVGFTGTEGLLGAENEELGHSHTEIRIGKPIDHDSVMSRIKEKHPDVNHKRFMVDLLGFHVSGLLNPDKRGTYSFPTTKDETLSDVISFYLTECM